MNQLDLGTIGGLTRALAPELLLSAWSLIVLLVVAWRHRTEADSRLAGWLSLYGVVATGAVVVWMWASGAGTAGISNMMEVDGFRFATSILFLVAAGFSIVLSLNYVTRERMLAPEYYVLILLGTVGMMFMGGGADLIVLFLGLEVMSVSVYVLAGYDRRSAFSAEAALKYFLIGAFASGFLLYGIALVYGSTGMTNLSLIGSKLAEGQLPLMASLGLGLLVIGLAFKIAAVPFHMWAPDVYDGAPTPVTGFMATGVKAAGFAGLTRVLVEAFPSALSQWQPIVAIIAIVTMVVGNLVALVQRPLKRMLAYSSVAHAGYLLAALWPGTRLAVSTLLVYLAAYTLTTIASFAILAALGRNGERDITLDDIAGLASRRPWMAAALALCMLSLLGFPGTVGFIGKWYILQSVIGQGQTILAVVLVLTSVVSAGYYLPVIMSMYMRPAPEPEWHEGRGMVPLASAVVALCVIGVLVFGLWPTPILNLAQSSAGSMTQVVLPGSGR
ncbi:MAG: NADH-quinone oxidoreductase subunit N [Gemmatimonadota bacterium]